MIDTDDEVKKALNYLVGFKEEMTSDKKHYTGVLIREVKRLRKDRDLLWDAIRLSGTGGHQEEEIAFWHEKLLNMNEAELKEAFKKHYEDD